MNDDTLLLLVTRTDLDQYKAKVFFNRELIYAGNVTSDKDLRKAWPSFLRRLAQQGPPAELRCRGCNALLRGVKKGYCTVECRLKHT